MRVGFLQFFCLEELYNEAAKKDEEVITKAGKEIISCDKIESFKIKKVALSMVRQTKTIEID